ncbi:MAG TPA: helix-turn-helix transcriptional regulator [Gemmatimonadaceae bacterium]|nr:helix-turn-helix transcriptional regulator [Gemmatimonadaceae bacterium]
MPSAKSAAVLGRFEHLVLLAALHVRGDIYAVSIGAEIERRTGVRPARGAVYTTLARLEAKGFLLSSRGAATPVRGGKAKRVYRLTIQGRQALQRARSDMVLAWPRVARLLGDR